MSNLKRTKHLNSCPVYGNHSRDDEPCTCPKTTEKQYIKRLELKIELMRFFVPNDKEQEIDKKVCQSTQYDVPEIAGDEESGIAELVERDGKKVWKCSAPDYMDYAFDDEDLIIGLSNHDVGTIVKIFEPPS